MHTFTFHSDAGHGWLEVPRKMLQELGIREQISDCSYVKGDRAFLEEDCDASRFIHALRATGADFKTVDIYVEGDSPIRGYARFNPKSFIGK